MKARVICLVFVASVAVCLLAGVAAANQANDCIMMVSNAEAFIREKGVEYALKVFSTRNSPFVDKDLYIFVLSMDNVMLAHPFNPGLIGKNFSDHKDSNGKFVFQEFKKVVNGKGEGWVDYTWPKPGEQGEFPKSAYVKKVHGQDMYIGASYFK
ncbi:cache domain-containing protein [Desulfomonile tiedjei]|uniref:Cache domain protein n=1 Tax=Desulfomonile tiedjei (strain ATCC 49306 / DSM 6799 / DCB-1) TaxID=706587 RepID=I4CD75_DESTA|nr:cache domain-containing protein [Desulfomonile tiedjei]AFM27516.1 Cache domain protein [Desulfomonile tiedjei DSM 6799]